MVPNAEQDNISNTTAEEADDPWPLATTATLRVIAWPRYQDLDSLTKILQVAEPLFGNPNACLCLRYVGDSDIPLEQAMEQLDKAFKTTGKTTNLNVLIIDDEMTEDDWPRLGKALTCALQIEDEIDEDRSAFLSGLGIEIIGEKVSS